VVWLNEGTILFAIDTAKLGRETARRPKRDALEIY
jgi:hypothetical protein